MRHNRFRFYTVLVLLLLPISGCWDVNDLDQRTIVIALGLDATPANRVTVSAQIPLMETSLLLLGGQPSPKPFTIVSSQGKTAYGAALGLETKTINSLFWGQLQVAIVSTTVAQRGLKSYCEFLERHPEIPPLAYLALTESTAQDLLSLSLSSKFLPGLAINNYFSSRAKLDEVFPIRIWQLVKKVEVKPTDAYLPIITYDQKEQVYGICGIGVFDRDRLVGKLSENETRMAGIVMGKTRNTGFSVPIGKMGEITYRRVTVKSRITIRSTKPHIRYMIKINARGFGASITSDRTNLQNNEIKQIERVTARAMANEILKTLHHLQQLKSDIIGFGEQIRINRPALWKRLNWDDEYRQVAFQVQVKFRLDRVGKYR